jgi:structure-specific recognition protein 1
VLSKLFKELIKINILIPGDFRSAKGEEAIKCSVKASDGYLYPLKSSLIFIHKPVIYIKLSEIKYVEFSRIAQIGGSSLPSRSFDMTFTKLKDDGQFTFAGIDKEEQKNLTNYLKSKNVKMRTVDVETNQHIDLSDDEYDDEESKDSRKLDRGGKGGNNDEYDSEEEDEDFVDEDSP